METVVYNNGMVQFFLSPTVSLQSAAPLSVSESCSGTFSPLMFLLLERLVSRAVSDRIFSFLSLEHRILPNSIPFAIFNLQYLFAKIPRVATLPSKKEDKSKTIHDASAREKRGGASSTRRGTNESSSSASY